MTTISESISELINLAKESPTIFGAILAAILIITYLFSKSRYRRINPTTIILMMAAPLIFMSILGGIDGAENTAAALPIEENTPIMTTQATPTETTINPLNINNTFDLTSLNDNFNLDELNI